MVGWWVGGGESGAGSFLSRRRWNRTSLFKLFHCHEDEEDCDDDTDGKNKQLSLQKYRVAKQINGQVGEVSYISTIQDLDLPHNMNSN